MAKYTKGPWYTADRNEIRSKPYPSKGVIALCQSVQNGGVFEVVSNARLISKSPELAEALRDLLRAAPFHSVGCPGDWIEHEHCCSVHIARMNARTVLHEAGITEDE